MLRRNTDASLWWNMAGVVAAWQPVVAPGPLMARYNMVCGGTNAYRAEPGTAPTWASATGWGFTLASAQYLTTGITIPDTTYSAIARFSNVTVAGGSNEGYLIGSFGAINRYWGIAPVGFGGANNVIYAWGNFVQIVPALSSGVLAIAGLQPYRNGIAEAGTIPAGGLTSSRALYIGGVNGSPGYYLTGNIQALAIYARTLSASEVWSVTRQMQYCDTNPDWSVWARRRRWFYAPAAVGRVGVYGARPTIGLPGGVSIQPADGVTL